MTTSSQNALTNAQSTLTESVRRTDSDGTVTASPLVQAQVSEQSPVSITTQSKPVAPAFRHDHNLRHRGINRLPTELLVYIFKSCLDTDPDDTDRRDATQLYRIRAVCHLWKTVAEGNPVLWRYVSALDPPEHIHKALELSQPMSIAVVCNNFDSRVSEEAFRTAVEPHAARWDRAFIEYGDLNKADPQVWESSELSGLRSLEVISHSVEYTRNSIFINCGQGLPNLEEAKFANVPLRLNPGQLPGLRVLELTRCEVPDTSFSISKLLHLLTGAPHLERLSLFSTEIELDEVAFQGSNTFPSLTWLELEGVSPDGVLQLLSSIHLPQCDWDDNEADRQVSEEAPTDPDNIPFDDRDYDTLEVRDDGMHLWVGEFQLFISAGFDWSVLEYMEIVLERFATELASSKHIHAEIEVTDRMEAPAITAILNRLDRFANLRSLELVRSCGTAPLRRLIQLLSRPNVLSDRVVWYFPHLEFLFVGPGHAPFLELGQVCLERRRAAGISKCPKEIRELHMSPLITSLEEEFKSQVNYKIEQELDQLQSKLGRGQLFWREEPWRRLVNGNGPE